MYIAVYVFNIISGLCGHEYKLLFVITNIFAVVYILYIFWQVFRFEHNDQSFQINNFQTDKIKEYIEGYFKSKKQHEDINKKLDHIRIKIDEIKDYKPVFSKKVGYIRDVFKDKFPKNRDIVFGYYDINQKIEKGSTILFCKDTFKEDLKIDNFLKIIEKDPDPKTRNFIEPFFKNKILFNEGLFLTDYYFSLLNSIIKSFKEYGSILLNFLNEYNNKIIRKVIVSRLYNSTSNYLNKEDISSLISLNYELLNSVSELENTNDFTFKSVIDSIYGNFTILLKESSQQITVEVYKYILFKLYELHKDNEDGENIHEGMHRLISVHLYYFIDQLSVDYITNKENINNLFIFIDKIDKDLIKKINENQGCVNLYQEIRSKINYQIKKTLLNLLLKEDVNNKLEIFIKIIKEQKTIIDGNTIKSSIENLFRVDSDNNLFFQKFQNSVDFFESQTDFYLGHKMFIINPDTEIAKYKKAVEDFLKKIS